MDFNEILQNIDWMSLLGTIWTIVFVPIGKAIYDWLKSKKLDGYGVILYEEVIKAVKSVQQAVVDDLKNGDGWTDEKKQEAKELAKNKAIQALSSIVYRTLKEANDDFDSYLDNLVETAIFDIKNGLK